MFVDFNILNQLGSPAINSNTFANRPAAGQTGRLFVSTDTFEIYRDNGSTWDLIGGPGSSTITGTGTATQVAYFTSSQAIGSSANLFWDNTNTRLGIRTATPGASLDVHSAADVAMQLNGTGATPTVLQQFLSAGVAQYELGYNWNASADYRRFSIYDTAGAKEVISIDQQSRRVGINFQYSSLTDQPQYTLDVDGEIRGQNLYVTSNLENTKISNTKPVGGAGQNVFFGNGGANVVFTTVDTGSYNTGIGWGSLSLLTTGYRNVAIGQVALEQLTTGYNNVAIGDNCGRFYASTIGLTNAIECIFIGRNTQASADNITNEIVIGANATGLGSNSITLGNSSITKTYLRGEVLINTTTDSGAYNLQVNGAGYLGGNLDIEAAAPILIINGTFNGKAGISLRSNGTADAVLSLSGYFVGDNSRDLAIIGETSRNIRFYTNGDATTDRMRMTTGGNFLIGTTTDAGQKLQVNGNILVGTSHFIGDNNFNSLLIQASSGENIILNAPDELFIQTNSTDRIVVKNGGSIGIGTNLPGAKLEVNGDIKTGAPTTGTAAAWKLGTRVAAAVVLDATQYIEVEVGGTFYKLAIVT